MPPYKLTQPQNYDSHENGLGHDMKSYMNYIPSKIALIMVVTT